MVIINHDLKWKYARTKMKKIKGIVLHHTDGDNNTVESIHQQHQANGWNGIGYNFLIYKNGSIHEGRGGTYQGAHSGVNLYNDYYIGIAVVGRYSITKELLKPQYDSVMELCKLLQEKYKFDPKEIYGHRDVYSTECPGKYYPLQEIKSNYLTYNKEEKEDMTPEQVRDIVRDETQKLRDKRTKLSYADVDDWAKASIRKLQNANLLNGSDRGDVDKTIEQIENLVILERAMTQVGEEIANLRTETYKSFENVTDDINVVANAVEKVIKEINE